MAAGVNRSAAGLGKGITMHETYGVEFATTPRDRCGLHYAEQGDQTGEAIIFLHGYSDSWYSFSRVLPLLSPELQPDYGIP
jgi:hypothetical protein